MSIANASKEQEIVLCQVFKVSISLPIPGRQAVISLAEQTYILYGHI